MTTRRAANLGLLSTAALAMTPGLGRAQPQMRATRSHGNALADALALGGTLGCLLPRVCIFAIVDETFAIGAPLSPAVRAAIPKVMACILREARCRMPDCRAT